MDMFEFKGDARIQKVGEQLAMEPVKYEYKKDDFIDEFEAAFREEFDCKDDFVNNAKILNKALEEEREREKHPQFYQDMHSYNALILSTFPPLPKETAKHEAPAPGDNLSYKERRKQKKESRKQEEEEYKKKEEEYKNLGKSQKLLDYKEVQNLSLFQTKEGRDKWADTKLGRSKLTRRETMEMVGRKDYSNFENLDDVMRNMFAKEALRRFIDKYTEKDKSIFDYSAEMICNKLNVSKLLDPALRLGLSLAQKEINGFAPEHREWFRRLDEKMSATVMLSTIQQKDAYRQDQQKKAIAKELVEKHAMNEQDALKSAQDMVEANKAQQIQIAKRLLLMNMGGLMQVDKDGNQSSWDRPVSVALSHCSRVTLILPKCGNTKEDKKEYQEMWNSIFYLQDERGEFNSNRAQDNRRAASTHSIKTRKKDGDEILEEKKVLFNLRGQRGMNVAIGGLGNQGIGGKMILNDGSCGHFYSMYKEGDTGHNGVILMGLESDCPGMTNQMGHIHDIKAIPEKASSLGGQRADEVGVKYGGRRCNRLQNWSPRDITKCMRLLENAMRMENINCMNRFQELLVTGMMDFFPNEFIDTLEQLVEDSKQGIRNRPMAQSVKASDN